MKVLKRVGIVILCLVVLAGIGIFAMGKQTKSALDKQVNADIDMSKVQDGTYEGDSDGGLVKVEVEVQVQDHKIENIKLVKHDNGKGKPAEAMLDEMVAKNTDNVDTVSGATASSKTIRNAVNTALQKGIR